MSSQGFRRQISGLSRQTEVWCLVCTTGAFTVAMAETSQNYGARFPVAFSVKIQQLFPSPVIFKIRTCYNSSIRTEALLERFDSGR